MVEKFLVLCTIRVPVGNRRVGARVDQHLGHFVAIVKRGQMQRRVSVPGSELKSAAGIAGMGEEWVGTCWAG